MILTRAVSWEHLEMTHLTFDLSLEAIRYLFLSATDCIDSTEVYMKTLNIMFLTFFLFFKVK